MHMDNMHAYERQEGFKSSSKLLLRTELGTTENSSSIVSTLGTTGLDLMEILGRN